MTPVEKAVIVPQCERRFFFSSFSFFLFYFSPFFYPGGRTGGRERGECESVNVFHSADIIHRFNKAGICSIRWDHCAIEGRLKRPRTRLPGKK